MRGDGGGGLNDFKFGTFIGRFPSDRAASMAVKWLILRVKHKKWPPCLLHRLTHSTGVKGWWSQNKTITINNSARFSSVHSGIRKAPTRYTRLSDVSLTLPLKRFQCSSE